MNTKMILIIAFSMLYGFFEILMSRRLKSKRNVSQSGDKGSIWLLFITISIGYWLSFILAATKIGREFMIEHMGQKYVDYQNRTKRLIPMIY